MHQLDDIRSLRITSSVKRYFPRRSRMQCDREDCVQLPATPASPESPLCGDQSRFQSQTASVASVYGLRQGKGLLLRPLWHESFSLDIGTPLRSPADDRNE